MGVRGIAVIKIENMSYLHFGKYFIFVQNMCQNNKTPVKTPESFAFQTRLGSYCGLTPTLKKL